MSVTLTTIGLDADDTLWHNERFFALTQDHFADLLRDHTDKEHLMIRLLAAERRNLPHYGFGIKGFTLSMIETAIEVTDGRCRPVLSVNCWMRGAICCPIRSNCCRMWRRQ